MSYEYREIRRQNINSFFNQRYPRRRRHSNFNLLILNLGCIVVNISKFIYLNCGERHEDMIYNRSYTHSQAVERDTMTKGVRFSERKSF